MELSVAKKLIEPGLNSTLPTQVWADLGAGTGLFTKALSELLPDGSEIFAFDQDAGALKKVSSNNPNVHLHTVVGDLNQLPATFPLCDGIVMANALHYVKDQEKYIRHLSQNVLRSTGSLILVEYDLENANPWVPFPISKRKLAEIALSAGFFAPQFFHSVKSSLNRSEIYSALLKPKA